MEPLYIILSALGVVVWFGIVLFVADMVLGRIISRAGRKKDDEE